MLILTKGAHVGQAIVKVLTSININLAIIQDRNWITDDRIA
jgi:hypothetical protein